MITIIKEGTLREGKCTHCGCVFTFEAEDVNGGLEGNWLNCPQCSEKYYVSQRKAVQCGDSSVVSNLTKKREVSLNLSPVRSTKESDKALIEKINRMK